MANKQTTARFAAVVFLSLSGCGNSAQQAYDECNDGMGACFDVHGVHLPEVNVCLRYYNACIEAAGLADEVAPFEIRSH